MNPPTPSPPSPPLPSPPPPPTILILGGGIIGLTSALTLQSQLHVQPPSQPTILLLATDLPSTHPHLDSPPDYASMWAGAHVRPIPATTPTLHQEAAWLRRTVPVFRQQAARERDALGVRATRGVEVVRRADAVGAYDEAWRDPGAFEAETGLRGFRREEMGDRGVKGLGFEYETFCVNAPVYCAALLRRFVFRGGKVVRGTVGDEWDAFAVGAREVDRLGWGPVACVVNASGRGFGDAKVFVTRGQTVLTANHTDTTVTHQNADGTWTFAIPRFLDGGTVIGGTKEPHDWHPLPRPETRAALLRNARQAFPDLFEDPVDDKVIADIVGRRPTREGGMRVEIERRMVGGTERAVVHAYGAGGRGFEMSWGVAEDVAGLVGEVMQGCGGRKEKL